MTEQRFSKGDRVTVTVLGQDATGTVTAEELDDLDATWYFITFDQPTPYLDAYYYPDELERIEEVAA